MLSRRAFLLTAASVPAGVVFYTFYVEPHWLEIVDRPLPVRGLPTGLEGSTLVQLSDLHVGPKVDDAYVIETFERVARLAPDIVVVTGDFISHHAGFLEQVERVYAHLPRGRLATLGIFGNHDYGPNWSHPEVADALAGVLPRFGIRILRNEIAEVGGLQVLGLDDLWGTNFRPLAALQLLDPERASIVLSHNPDSVDEPVWDGYAGWILSGHTHGGQCKPPFLPPPMTPVRNKRYTAGELALSGGRRLYINRGVGHLLEVRFNVRPEVTVFRLTAA